MVHKLGYAAVLAIVVAGLSAPGVAAPCKDAKGKFIKCPVVASAPAPGTRCKTDKGKFAKCGTPGAAPIK